MKKLFLNFTVVLTVLGLVVFLPYLGYRALLHWENRNQYFDTPVQLELKRGTSLQNLSQQLVENGLVDSAFLFKLWVRVRKDYSKFKAGNYRFVSGVTPKVLASHFLEGRTYEPILVQLSVPEGFTYKLIAAKAVSLNIGTASEYLKLAKDQVFRSSLLVNSSSLEGYLYPATYQFTKLPTAKEFLSKCVETFWERLPKNYLTDVKNLGLSLNQAVTFASLIELETPHHSERNLVSEVIWNRLKKKMALGIDAAIIYGIPNFTGNLRQRHLDDAANRYNTRIHPGLPPTPIGSPSLDSLQAVLSPSNKGYLYYVVDPSTGNYHHFSKTLKEHNKYVRKLISHQRNLNK